MTYTNAALFPVMLAVRGVQRLTGLAPEDEARARSRCRRLPSTRRSARCSPLEAGIVQAVPMPFGSSLLCLATKPA